MGLPDKILDIIFRGVILTFIFLAICWMSSAVLLDKILLSSAPAAWIAAALMVIALVSWLCFSRIQDKMTVPPKRPAPRWLCFFLGFVRGSIAAGTIAVLFSLALLFLHTEYLLRPWYRIGISLWTLAGGIVFIKCPPRNIFRSAAIWYLLTFGILLIYWQLIQTLTLAQPLPFEYHSASYTPDTYYGISRTVSDRCIPAGGTDIEFCGVRSFQPLFWWKCRVSAEEFASFAKRNDLILAANDAAINIEDAPENAKKTDCRAFLPRLPQPYPENYLCHAAVKRDGTGRFILYDTEKQILYGFWGRLQITYMVSDK